MQKQVLRVLLLPLDGANTIAAVYELKTDVELAFLSGRTDPHEPLPEHRPEPIRSYQALGGDNETALGRPAG